MRRPPGLFRRRGSKFQAVRDRDASRKMEQPAEPCCRRDIHRNATAQKASNESQQPKSARCKPAQAAVAAKAFARVARHEVSWARRSRGLDEKLAVRANRLEAVMLDDDRLVCKEPEDKRRKRGACHVHSIGSPNQIPQMNQTRPAHDTKWEPAVVELVRGSLRDNGDLEFRFSPRRTKPCEAPSQRQDDSLNAADARCKKVGIDQQLHPRNFPGASGAA